jgi:hypothetical protein
MKAKLTHKNPKRKAAGRTEGSQQRVVRALPESAFVITKEDQAIALGSNEIKTCPHCGAWAFSIGTKNEETGNTVYHVNCSNTKCMAQSFYCSKDPAEARTKAIERWNRRAP